MRAYTQRRGLGEAGAATAFACESWARSHYDFAAFVNGQRDLEAFRVSRPLPPKVAGTTRHYVASDFPAYVTAAAIWCAEAGRRLAALAATINLPRYWLFWNAPVMNVGDKKFNPRYLYGWPSGGYDADAAWFERTFRLAPTHLTRIGGVDAITVDPYGYRRVGSHGMSERRDIDPMNQGRDLEKLYYPGPIDYPVIVENLLRFASARSANEILRTATQEFEHRVVYALTRMRTSNGEALKAKIAAAAAAAAAIAAAIPVYGQAVAAVLAAFAAVAAIMPIAHGEEPCGPREHIDGRLHYSLCWIGAEGQYTPDPYLYGPPSDCGSQDVRGVPVPANVSSFLPGLVAPRVADHMQSGGYASDPFAGGGSPPPPPKKKSSGVGVVLFAGAGVGILAGLLALAFHK